MGKFDSGDFFAAIKKWNSFIHSGNIQYTSAIVGIVDILAFRNLLSEYKDNAPKVIADLFAREMMSTEAAYNELKFKILSDTLIVYSPDDSAASALNVLNVLDNFSMELLKKGYLTRGAVVRGRHFLKDDIMVSPAFIEAYLIEQNLCIYPRVIISDEIASEINEKSVLGVDGLYGLYHDSYFRIISRECFIKDIDGYTISLNGILDGSIYFLTYGKSDIDNRTIKDVRLEDIIIDAHSTLCEFKKGIELTKSRAKDAKEKMKVSYVINRYNSIVNNMRYDEGRHDLLIESIVNM